MTEEHSTHKSGKGGLIAAIVFAAVIISGSMVFLGSQMSADAGVNVDDLDKDQLASLLAAKESQVTAPYEKLVDDDPMIGDKTADVTIIEFSDYQCPYCRRHFTQTFTEIKKNYIDTGKVKYVFRDFPLSFHKDALPASMAGECVREQTDDDTYYLMQEKIFNEAADGSIPKESLVKFAQELGVDMTEFNTCMDTEKYKNEVNADMTAATSFGVKGAPGFIITDGENSKLIKGAIPYDSPTRPTDFKREIESFLN